MSDLINRSELIENFRKCYSGHLGMENSDACMTFHGICNVINNTNTAYDVDKVVEDLELHSFEFGTDTLPAHYVRLNDAIEIVKHGGVSDDVCEWKVKSNYYVTKCSHDTDIMYGLKQDFKYCPYCSKKIKVVE